MHTHDVAHTQSFHRTTNRAPFVAPVVHVGRSFSSSSSSRMEIDEVRACAFICAHGTRTVSIVLVASIRNRFSATPSHYNLYLPFQQSTASTLIKTLSTSPFPAEVINIISAPVNPDEVEIKPDGLIYMPAVTHRYVLARGPLSPSTTSRPHDQSPHRSLLQSNSEPSVWSGCMVPCRVGRCNR